MAALFGQAALVQDIDAVGVPDAGHGAGGCGAVLGDVDQPPELRVLGGFQFRRRGGGQVLGRGDRGLPPSVRRAP
ncbi:hypothetical protein [Streptomyces sp. KMM 9044]|uniref:hypothetical protein n=1 Tax=Streptomyces sp. KMM 9044 TaxID=2744474 RepID=UPI0021516E32|nr:hypothetical protein [Streptomyces sp. KMM 9044]WAX76683.1 hypothetical protein HUV60_002320 [Streptomyces sp. KMM 9044]